MSILEIDLTPDLHRRIDEEAQMRGLSPSEYVCLSVADLLSPPILGERPLHDAMEFAGAGREALRGVDVDQFIRELRAEWDDQP